MNARMTNGAQAAGAPRLRQAQPERVGGHHDPASVRPGPEREGGRQAPDSVRPELVEENGAQAVLRPAQLGFLGVGWIGRHRLQALLQDGSAEALLLCDSDPASLEAAAALAPRARTLPEAAHLPAGLPLDGLVIATPSALHAAQARAALEAGLAVFCQKPLARTAAETRAVIEAAQRADRRLGVDLCYRHTAAARAVAAQVRSGELGEVYAIDLVFHNAYGPDKAWFRDPALAGGGCLIDLGTHLVDLALWVMDFPVADEASARLYAQGRRLGPAPDEVEDHALAQFTLAPGTSVRLACSWNLSAGRDAVIEAHFHGTRGSARMTNVDGSFYDFVAERCHGTRAERLAGPPDDWGGRAAVQWARAVATGGRFDAEAWQALRVAELLDQLYGRA